MLNSKIILNKVKTEYQEYLKSLERLTKQEIITESAQTAFYGSLIDYIGSHSFTEKELNILSGKNALYKLYNSYLRNNYDTTNSTNFNLVFHRYIKEQEQGSTTSYNELLCEEVEKEYAGFKTEISSFCSADEILNNADKIYFFNKLHGFLISNHNLSEDTCSYLYGIENIINTLYDSFTETNLSEGNEGFYVVNTNYDIETFIDDFYNLNGCNYTETGSQENSEM